MECPNCKKRLLTRKERKNKQCLRCGHGFSLIKGKVEFSKEVKSQEGLEKLDKIYNAESKNIDIVLDKIYYVLNKLADKKFKKWKLKSFESGLDQLYFKFFFLNGKELELKFKIKGSE